MREKGCDFFYLRLNVRCEQGSKRPKREKKLLLIKYSSLEGGNIIHDPTRVQKYHYTISIYMQKSFTLLAFQLMLLSYIVRNSASAT